MARGSSQARRLALVVALLAAGSLALQFVLIAHRLGSPGAALSSLSQYFTVLTNLMVLLAMAGIATGRRVSANLLGMIATAIAGVGIVYHTTLARLWAPEHWDWLADQGLHTAVPIAMVVWWLLYADKARLSWRAPLDWLAWPLGYCLYALGRGHVSGFYPYPFIDLPKLGWPTLIGNAVILAAGFAVLGYALLGLGKLLSR